jgi:hypothetical protein
MQYIADVQRNIKEGVCMNNEFKKVLFSLDCLPDYAWVEGMTYGNYWNGWGCPYFTKENGLKVVEYCGFDLTYSEEKDAFIHTDEDCDDEDNTTEFDSTLIDGVKYYAIGSHSWCWHEKDFHLTDCDLEELHYFNRDTLVDLLVKHDKDGDFLDMNHQQALTTAVASLEEHIQEHLGEEL